MIKFEMVAACNAGAGVATGAVYRYLPSKEELVAALIDAVPEREISLRRSRTSSSASTASAASDSPSPAWKDRG